MKIKKLKKRGKRGKGESKEKRFLIWGKYFGFFKLDKKNVQKKIVPIFYENWNPL